MTRQLHGVGDEPGGSICAIRCRRVAESKPSLPVVRASAQTARAGYDCGRSAALARFSSDASSIAVVVDRAREFRPVSSGSRSDQS